MKQLIITQSFTNRDSAAFERYLSDVEKLPMIDAEREAELSARILSGDHRAIDELVVANLRFGISVAKKYQNLGLPLEDLVAEANAGLIKAVVFGGMIATVACNEGLKTTGGALGVGRSTRAAVRDSIIGIIVLNYFMTWFMYQA